ncbi:MAG: polyprenyl synthetase family protein [Actinobacteria bacterium]|nr:polyprenyl synthetase family protein [Actinomycetota bacterium]
MSKDSTIREISADLTALVFLKQDLKKLEEFFNRFTEGLEGILQETVRSTLNTAGKRIRPILLLICAKNETYDIEYLLPAAAAIEIIHTASLIHDDIIDKSVLRRGKKTIHNIYNRDTAKFVGDYLFTHTFFLLNGYNIHGILAETSEAAKMLVRGEFDQLKTKRDLNQTEEIYLEKISEKTSSLFKLSCALGGTLSGSEKSDIENMKKFGEYIGISFQINDDLIDADLTQSSSRVGKPVGNDLIQGDITLPYIYGFSSNFFKREVKLLLSKKNINADDIRKILAMLAETGAIEQTKRKFNHYLEKAQETVKLIKGPNRRTGLYAICNAIMSGSRQVK